HVGKVDVAAIEDLERVEQLAPEERRAARIPCERCECRHRRPDAAEAAEIRLHAPDGRDDPRRDAVFLADLVQELALVGVAHASSLDALGREYPFQIVLEWKDDLSLRAIALEDDRHGLVEA